MTPENWQKVKEILAEALELSLENRAAFVAEACGADAEIKREVDSLLEYENTRGKMLDDGAFAAITENAFDENLDAFNGKKIGNYKIVRLLGAGGMGAVFLAERADGEFAQKVALKLIKKGMNSAQVLRRFFNERQILASLEHPKIAHLIDGGTTSDETPYFVMEYVEGETIIEYAARKNLDLEAKLNLFREVCAAVAFAHRNLVIHRDLKPSNILVNRDGEPKLLDFGIAKLHNPESTGETATQNFVFTPEYASPEQVRGEKLTTATDVYSLGVILYELLTGARPYKTDSRSIGAIIKAVCETDPIRPSSVVSGQLSFINGQPESENATAKNKERRTENKEPQTNFKSQTSNSKSLRGDLDNIILKALRKEPEKRYSSVEQFAEDIRRHQNGQTVSATKGTWKYRAGKFIKRNRLAATAAAAVLLALIAGFAATAYQYNKAQRRFNDVRQLANSFLFEFHDAIETLPGATPARELVVRRAVEYLDKLAQESSGDVDLQRELAAAYQKVGRIQGNSYFSNLGDSDGAMKNISRALEIRERLAAADPNNSELRHELAVCLQDLGDMEYTVNNLPATQAHYARGLEIMQKISAAAPENKIYLMDLAEMRSRLGDVTGLEGFPNLGDTMGALENYRQATQINEELLESEPENSQYQLHLARRYSYLGMLQNTVGDSQNALETGLKSVALQEKLVAAEPNNTDRKLNLLSALIALRFPLVDEGKLPEAIANARRIIKTIEDMRAADPQNAFFRRSLGVSYNSLGTCLREAGDIKNSIAAHQQALKIADEIYAEKPNSENLPDVSITRFFLAQSQILDKDYDSALKNMRQTAAEYEKQLAADSSNKKAKDDLSGAYDGIARSLAATGNLQNALDYHRRALKLAEEVAAASPLNARIQSRFGQLYYDAGLTLLKLAEYAPEKRIEATQSFEKSRAVWESLRARNALRGVYLKNFERISAEIARK